MVVHFVYAGSPDDGRIQSPYCITKNLFYYLKERTEVKYYLWDGCDDVVVGPDDVFIGHPHYDPNTTVQRFFRSGQVCRLKCTIHPLHTVRVGDNMPFDWMTRIADKVFSICGPYWVDTIGKTPFAHWASKITRLDIPVDPLIYKHWKKTFNEVGHRGVVYVGSAMPQKNLAYLYEIVKSFPTVKFRWYGGSGDHPLASLPNMRVFGWCDFSDQGLLKDLFDFADIFINTSISDANPTTLSEFALAGGLAPIVTETSGYWRSKSFINISHDLGDAVRVLTEWLLKPSQELVNLSAYNRAVCERDFTWEKFCSTVWNGIKPVS